MKVAAVRALADLAKEEVPNAVLRAYGVDQMAFGPDYIIPKPLDYRVLFRVAPAVARAAVDSGVAGITRDLDGYTVELEKRLGLSRDVIRTAIQKAKSDPRRIVFPEGEHEQILRAARVLVEEGIAVPVLLGSESIIRERMAALGVDLPGIAIEDPKQSPQRDEYVRELHNLRKRKGVTLSEAEQLVDNLNIFGSLMVNAGHADGLVSGLTYSYPDTIRPALQVIGTRDGVRHVSGLSIVIIRGRVCFFADTTVNIAPDAETLAEIALEAADLVQRLNIVPRVALLSFSNFGSAGHAASTRVRDAVNLVRNRRPNLVIDGEMQADTAVNPAVAQETFSFSAIQGDANVLVFPDLQSGNIAYKLLQGLGGAEIIGPILMGMRKSVHVLQRGSDVNTVVNMAAFAVLDAQDR
jgi:malate dehydrogenase (oxaloacetate-decarboxylating)(NADP+)